MAQPNFMEKTFASGSKTQKFVNFFSLESFPLYGIIAGNFCGVLIFVIFMVDSVVTEISTHDN